MMTFGVVGFCGSGLVFCAGFGLACAGSISAEETGVTRGEILGKGRVAMESVLLTGARG